MQRLSTIPHRSFSSSIIRWWNNWYGNPTGLIELQDSGTRELKHIARNTNVETQAGRWPEPTNPLAERMRALHLDAHEVDRTQPLLSNDLRTACTLCGAKRECADDIAKNATDPNWKNYCPNAKSLTALARQKRVPTI